MSRTKWLQETRQMRFEEVYQKWYVKRLRQEEAAHVLGGCERTFRRYINRYEEEGLEGLLDKGLNQVSHRKAPVDEVVQEPLKHRVKSDEKPMVYSAAPSANTSERGGNSEWQTVSIPDGRPLIDRLSLDEASFELRAHDTAVSNFYKG